MTDLVPKLNEHYYKTSVHDDVEKIISTRMFYPFMVVGPSGIGKTMMIDQVCHDQKRELVRVNITIETDEDSLFGGFRLKNGETFFDKGPVAFAMERGAILLLDEYDLGSPTKMMCLQSVLEGAGYFIKKISQKITPAEGFNVVATSNTKGIGDETGMYIGTQMMNEASLDRFPITFEMDYPIPQVERAILLLNVKEKTKEIEKAIDILVMFANNVRKSIKEEGNIVYNISTRRLVNMIKAYEIYEDLEVAVKYCIQRYDNHHKEAYMNFLKTLIPYVQQAGKKKQSKVPSAGSSFIKKLRSIPSF